MRDRILQENGSNSRNIPRHLLELNDTHCGILQSTYLLIACWQKVKY